MNITAASTGLQLLRERLAEARAQLPSLLQQAVQEAGKKVSQNLSKAAPVGASGGGGTPPEGDSSGPLSASFFIQEESAPSSTGAAISVRTHQPTKLGYVRHGTGIYGSTGQRIRPKVKQALSWEGARHPVRSVAGQKPNDFVTPVLDAAPSAQEGLQPVIDLLSALWEGV